MSNLISRFKISSYAVSLVLAYGAVAMAYFLCSLTLIQNIEMQTLDWRFIFRGPVGEKPEELVLISVDEKADLDYHQPLPRHHLAAVIRTLQAAQVRLIGLDVFLDERSFDAVGDSLLRQAILESGNVVLSSLLKQDVTGPIEQLPLPYFAAGALDRGIDSFYGVSDMEIVREGQLVFGIDGLHVLSFAGSLYAQSKGWNTEQLRQIPWKERIKEFPDIYDDYQMLINFNGPPYQYYQSSEEEAQGGLVVLSSQRLLGLDPASAHSLLDDRIVLIGSGFEDASRRFPTPFFSAGYGYNKTFNTEIQTQLLHTLLQTDRLTRLRWIVRIALLLGLGFIVAVMVLRLSVFWALPVTLIGMLTWWVGGFWLFNQYAVVVPLLAPTFTCGIAYLLAVVYRRATDGRRHNELRERFGAMLSPAQFQELLNHPESWETESEERLVAVIWVKLESSSRQRSARETLLFYQGIWERCAPKVFQRGGTVFRYEEDGLGIVFGVPLPQKNPEEKAVLTAIDLQEDWLDYRDEAIAEGWDLRIGAAVGPALVGDLGGDVRYAYRVLGGAVERARMLTLEQQGDGVYISHEMMHQVGDLVEGESIGKIAEEEVYRLNGKANAPSIGAARGLRHPLWKHFDYSHRKQDHQLELFIGGLSIFSDFTRRDLRVIRPLFFSRIFNAGETVFRRGEVGSAMYIVQRGTVDIMQEDENVDNKQLLQRLHVGDFFGELALLSDLERSATAIAYEPTELLVLFQNDMFLLVESDPELGVRLIRMLSGVLGERLMRLNEEYIHNLNMGNTGKEGRE